jgi:hypothetical protein
MENILMIMPHLTTTTPKRTNWIKIDGQTFEIEKGDAHFSTGSHATISIRLDLKKNPTYYQFFIKKYEEQSSNSKSSKFDVHHRHFIARGTLIKTMDVSFDDEMNLSLICDILDPTNPQERRDEIIDDILNDETFPKDNNIT